MALALPALLPFGGFVSAAFGATFLVGRYIQKKIKYRKMKKQEMKKQGLLDDVNVMGSNKKITICHEAIHIKFYLVKRCVVKIPKRYYHAALLATFTYQGKEYNLIVEGTEKCSKLVPFINTSPELKGTTRSFCGSKTMAPYALAAMCVKNPLSFKEYSIKNCNCYQWLEAYAPLLGPPIEEELVYYLRELKESVGDIAAFIGSYFGSVSS